MKNITTFNFEELEQFEKIFVLVSGGIDSTYLYEMIYPLFPEKTFAVNCWNPYEQSKTLDTLKQFPHFLSIQPAEEYDYRQILEESFQNLPQAFEAKRAGKYHKKIFPCCYYIKHKAFFKDQLFQQDNTVVISGIKYGDGQQRRFWLTDMKKRDLFFHKHKTGQLYCYPFRDYKQRELPEDILNQLRKKYPALDHSGCKICPVLVLFDIEDPRTQPSKEFYYKLINQKKITDFIERRRGA